MCTRTWGKTILPKDKHWGRNPQYKPSIWLTFNIAPHFRVVSSMMRSMRFAMDGEYEVVSKQTILPNQPVRVPAQTHKHTDMHACIHPYIHACMCVCVYVCMYVCVWLHACMRTYRDIHASHAHLYTYISILYTHMHFYTYAYAPIDKYVNIFVTYITLYNYVYMYNIV